MMDRAIRSFSIYPGPAPTPLSDMSMAIRILFWLAAMVFLPLGTAYAERPVLTIGTTNSPPLSLPDQTGMLDRMLKEAFARIGVEVRFVTLPSERSLIEAEHGVIDGDSNRVAGLEARYPHLIQVPESNMTYEFMAFATRPDMPIKSWADLNAMHVAHVIGWKIFEDNVSAFQVTKLPTSKQLFLFLQAGRADVALFDRIGGGFLLGQLKGKPVYAIEPPLAKREMFLYLHARHADKVPALAKALRAMKEEGAHAGFFALKN